MENQHWINMLKFKISYSTQGNDNLMYERAGFIVTITIWTNTHWQTCNGDFLPSCVLLKQRHHIKETSLYFNTGFDFTFWDGKLSSSVDTSRAKPPDMLSSKPVASSLSYSRMPETTWVQW